MAVRHISLVALVLLVTSSPLPAEEGRRPVWESPTVISAPGQYVLTRNLLPDPGGGSVITISGPHVDLDLNGFHIDNGASTSPVIDVQSAFAEVRIHDGTVTGGAQSIAASSGKRLVVEDMNLHFSGANAIVASSVDEVVIRNNRISDIASEAIYVTSATSSSGIIEGNQLRRASVAIRLGDVSGLTIRLNQIEDTPSDGIQVYAAGGLLIERNSVGTAQGFGIFLHSTHGSTLRNNVLHGNLEAGIYLYSNCTDNLILENVVSETIDNHGILILGSRNQVEGNLANSNAYCGFHFESTSVGNIYRRNIARGNNGPNCVATCAAPVVISTDLCDQGTSNTSALDNFLPNPGM